MIRTLIAAALALLATPAIADTIPIVDGVLTVHNGDILVTSKPLVEWNTNGVLTERLAGGWVNRMDGKRFTLSGGASRLGVIGPAMGGYSLNAYQYQVLDGTSAVVTPPAAPVVPPQPAGTLYGINVSGGEFKGMDNGQFLPTPADLDAYYAVGDRMFRIPIKIVQLDNSTAKLTALANECIKLGTPCVFDNHSYAWPDVPTQIAQVVHADAVLPKSPLIQWGLQNEPGLKLWEQWATDSQAIITGYRAAGATIRVWIDYPGSSGAQRFDKGKRAPATCDSAACSLAKLPTGTLVDPLHLTGIDMHRYFDTNGSGTSVNCAPYVVIASAAKLAIPFGLPIMLGEYAFGSDAAISPTCTTLAPSIMAEIKASPNLYGVTLWGGGSRWGSYMFRALPVATSPYIQMTRGK